MDAYNNAVQQQQNTINNLTQQRADYQTTYNEINSLVNPPPPAAQNPAPAPQQQQPQQVPAPIRD